MGTIANAVTIQDGSGNACMGQAGKPYDTTCTLSACSAGWAKKVTTVKCVENTPKTATGKWSDTLSCERKLTLCA